MVLETNLEDKKNKNEFESLLNEDFKKRDLKEGSIVKATISEIGKKYVFVDLKAKSEGIIPIQEFQIAKEADKLKVGLSISVYLERIESFRTGEIVVSREKARRYSSWKKMEAAFKEQREVDGVIVNRCKGGFVVNIDSCLCFLPGSQIDAKPLKNFDHLMNTPLKFLCVKLDDVRGNIVVSRRAVLEKSRNESLDKLLTKFKEGSIVEGQVKAILDWGAFLDLNGVDALLHVTDMAYSRVKKPGDLLSIGQTISVKIIKIDFQTRRISCGIKQMHSDPYENLEKKYKVGEIYEGVVQKVVEYGAFVKLEEGLEGLVHQSELSWTKKNVHPSKLLSSSQKIKTKIIEIDSEKRRISLSYKQTLENPWNNFIKKYSVGSTVNATVKSISDFALFVSIEDTEFTGMIHYKDISWKESEESLKKFQKRSVVKAKILEIEREKEIVEEEELNGNEKGLSSNTFNQIDDVLFEIDKFKNIKFLNTAATKKFGKKLQGKHIATVLRVPEILQNIDVVLSTKKNKKIDIELNNPTFQFFSSYIILNNQNSVVIFLKDLTEIIKTQRLRSDFVANVSHELRTPLQSIKLGLETINKGHASNDFESQKKFLPILFQQTVRMENIVRDLLSLSKIELQEHIRPEKKVDIKKIISSVIEMNNEILKKNEIQAELKAPDNEYEILGDQDRLTEVFSNLIDNAAKYSKKGKKIFVNVENNEEFVIVSIKDQGIGIPKEYIHRVTERFFRVNPSKSKDVGGTGLGLAIVKHIINQHRADMDIKSEEGVGTEFILKFPAI